jgi:hypothetical protein
LLLLEIIIIIIIMSVMFCVVVYTAFNLVTLDTINVSFPPTRDLGAVLMFGCMAVDFRANLSVWRLSLPWWNSTQILPTAPIVRHIYHYILHSSWEKSTEIGRP